MMLTQSIPANVFRPVAFFQGATEPLFSIGHVDSELRMDAAFPGCMVTPSFMCALLYSIVQMQNKGRASSEALTLHGMALNGLRQTVQNKATYADVGAIMILQGVAYRWNDMAGHKAHADALCTVRLSQHDAGNPCFTDLARTAFFW